MAYYHTFIEYVHMFSTLVHAHVGEASHVLHFGARTKETPRVTDGRKTRCAFGTRGLVVFTEDAMPEIRKAGPPNDEVRYSFVRLHEHFYGPELPHELGSLLRAYELTPSQCRYSK